MYVRVCVRVYVHTHMHMCICAHAHTDIEHKENKTSHISKFHFAKKINLHSTLNLFHYDKVVLHL